MWVEMCRCLPCCYTVQNAGVSSFCNNNNAKHIHAENVTTQIADICWVKQNEKGVI